MNDVMMTTRELINVMQAYEAGKTIEAKLRNYEGGGWVIATEPCWDRSMCIYRVKVAKPSIDWSAVSSSFNYLAVDEDGKAWLYEYKPHISFSLWLAPFGEIQEAPVFASFKVNNCNWEESLVERP